MICHAVFHLIVRELIEGSYELIAGERRLIAAIASNHTTIPAKILNLSDRDARSLAMAENLQREDLNVYEETLAVVGLIGALLELESIDETKALIVDFCNIIRRAKRSDGNTSITIETNASDTFDGNTSITIEPDGSNTSDGNTSITIELDGLDTSDGNTSIIIEPDGSDTSDGNTSITIETNLQFVERIIRSNLKGMSVVSFVINRLPLLDLSADIVAAIDNGLPYMKALAIAKVDNADARAELIRTVGEDNFNLSELKKMIKGLEFTDRAESDRDDSKTSPDLKVPKTRLTSILRQVKSMKQFDRVDELNDLLDRMEALMS